MMKYKYVNAEQTTIAAWENESHITVIDEGSTEFDAAVATGDIAPYTAPPEPTPEELLAAERSQMIVSKFQAKAALLNAGLLEDTQTAIQGADLLTQLAWADAQEFRRNSPMIGTLAGALELTDEQVDDLFRAAKGIEA